VPALGLRAVLAALERMPRSLALIFGGCLGGLAWLILGRRRRVAIRNVERVFGAELAPHEIRRIARQSFLNLGLLVVEFARLRHLDATTLEQRIEYEGWDRFVAAKARGRGVILLSAHFGAWELMPWAQAVRGEPMSFVVRPADDPRIEAIVRARREASGNRSIDKRSALRALLRALRAGETVGLLIDQHVPADRGVPTRFLDQEVFSTPVLATLALRTGAPILPGFIVRVSPDRYRIVIGAEVEVAQTGRPEEDLIETTRRCVAVVEGWVREYPGDWLWAHRRFRSAERASSVDSSSLVR